MRKGTSIAAALCLLVFMVIAVLTVTGGIDSFNLTVMNAVYALETAALTSLVRFVTNAGDWYVYIPAALLLLIFPRSRVRYGVPAAAVLALSAGLNAALKYCFCIERPDLRRLIEITGYSFPSGHSMNGAAFVGICALLYFRYGTKTLWRIAGLVLAFLFVLTIGFSRIYLGVHTPADVLGGYALGLALVMGALSVTDCVNRRAGRPEGN